MILGFKKQFVNKILDGSKIHTIREDKHHRWKAGNKIHFATGVRTKNYKQFKEGICTSVQEICINPSGAYKLTGNRYKHIYQNIIQNDGFDSRDEFWQWFDKPFKGIIIHWTDFVY